jgi:LysR family transcriptional regulator, transcriptional activator of nhaA
MQWLNYHHLYYLWMVAREGGVSKASDKLRLSQPTVSAQLKQLEESLGEKLFQREGRKLTLTDAGKLAFNYADQIFSLGRELVDTISRKTFVKPVSIRIGTVEGVSKHIAFRFIEPAVRNSDGLRLHCFQGTLERLSAQLVAHELDVIVSDSPIYNTSGARLFNHLIEESGISFLAAPSLVEIQGENFPNNIENLPFLFPMANCTLRLSLEKWFDKKGVSPTVVGEYQDATMLKCFAEAGLGAMAIPTMLEREYTTANKLTLIGRANEIKERIYAISAERRIKHPAVAKLLQQATETDASVESNNSTESNNSSAELQ